MSGWDHMRNAMRAVSAVKQAPNVQTIVEQLNKYLKKKLTLVEFDEHNGKELLGLFVEVLKYIDPTLDISLENSGYDDSQSHHGHLEEDVEGAVVHPFVAEQLLDFVLRVLNYRGFDDYLAVQRGILTAERRVIYSILSFALSRVELLQTRVYLYRYLSPIEIPEDLLASDDIVNETYMQLRSVQEEFKAVHKEVENAKKQVTGNKDVTAFRNAVRELEKEREGLTTSVSKAKRKVDEMVDGHERVKASTKLHSEQQEEKKLTTSIADQERLFHQAQRKLELVREREQLENRWAGLNDVDHVLDESTEHRNKLGSRLVNEVRPHWMQLRSMYEALKRVVDTPSEGITEACENVAAECHELENELQSLQDQLHSQESGVQGIDVGGSTISSSSLGSEAAGGLGIFKKQAALVSKRRHDTEQLREQLQQELDELRREVKDSGGAGDGAQKKKKKLSPEEFQVYAGQLRQKAAKYKQMRRELDSVTSEHGVLQRTIELLTGERDIARSERERLEQRHGVEGYTETHGRLQKVSEQKQVVDVQKGEVLEEISRVVERTLSAIKDKKAKMAPKVQELRQRRQEVNEMEVRHRERKDMYESTTSSLNKEHTSLTEECEKLEDDSNSSESLCHMITHQRRILGVLRRRSQKELEYQHRRQKYPVTGYTSFEDHVTKVVQKLEQQSKDLRERQKYVREHLEPNQKQVRWFQSLTKLLECKVRVYNEGGHGSPEREAGGSQDIMEYNNMQRGTYDRLVISQQ